MLILIIQQDFKNNWDNFVFLEDIGSDLLVLCRPISVHDLTINDFQTEQ